MSYGDRMSVPMRNLLLEHLDGAAVPIRQEAPQIRMALLERGWIKTDGREARALHTYITNKGREALAAALADWADATVAALLDQKMVVLLRREREAA